MARYNFRIAYKKGTKNARANALSRRSDFISKTDRKEALFKKGENGLEYSSKIATVYKVVKDLAIKQRIKDAYLGDTRARKAMVQTKEQNRGTLTFALDKTGLIRFRRMVYLLESIRKPFVKELYKALTLRHLRIEKTRDKVAECYYFPLIIKMVERVVKECEVCQKTKTVRRALYRLLMLPNMLKEL